MIEDESQSFIQTEAPAGNRQGRVIRWFMATLLLVFALNGVLSMISKRPVGVHMWAMCDRASVARNYFQDSMNFFEPRVHQTRNFDGITGLEFPLMNYGAAIFYKLFGFGEFWYRLLMLVVLAGGLVAGFRIGQGFGLDPAISALPPLLLLASPVLNYYSANFIPDTASLGFAMISWYLFFKVIRSSGWMMKMFFVITLSIACLIKVTSAINVVVMFILLLADRIGLLKKSAERFRNTGVIFVSLIIAIAATFTWYKYAEVLSREHGSSVFLMHSRPAQNIQEIKDVIWHIDDIWLSFYFPKVFNYFIVLSAFAFVILSTRINRTLWITTTALWCGNIGFFLLMLHQFRDHDYYIITLLPALFFTWLSLAVCFKRYLDLPRVKYGLLVILFALMLHSTFKVREHLAFRHRMDCWLYTWGHFADLIDIEPFVDRIGLKKEDKVLAIYDRSPNIVLYFLNRKGWSLAPEAGTDEIEYALNDKPMWLVTNVDSVIRQSDVATYFEEVPARKGSVLFYRKRLSRQDN